MQTCRSQVDVFDCHTIKKRSNSNGVVIPNSHEMQAHNMSKKANTPDSKRGSDASEDDQTKKQLTPVTELSKVTRTKGRRLWEFELILSFDPTLSEDHPLAGLNQEERKKARVKALGEVLASIAKRNAIRIGQNSELHGTIDDLP